MERQKKRKLNIGFKKEKCTTRPVMLNKDNTSIRVTRASDLYNAKVATVLDSIPSSSDTMESEGR